ncbi:3D domain-containing protein [Sporolactobacillus shoreicorticis]|uniref:3D domain-containing protein n=1 Tax=Sporolactobacillus shoreicorticis TaxID=1923877 RepID=A0ABW5S4L9_9BACL|nr:3D domain-containing protein [Sporolactobacillus shoreicorticis]MCO7124192.1 3D domain-containing protein [Sporolactobacillus shoreicorticis]
MKKILMTLAVAILIISGMSNSVEAQTKTKTIKVSATAYCEMGRTATGYNLKKHPKAKVIAVDPRVIPLGSKVKIPGYGTAIARDTGGYIKGKIIDVHFKTRHQALKWGRKHIKIKVYKKK